MVDGLGGVADHDQLGVVALGEEDLFDDGVGVLGFVQQQEVGVDTRPGQGPDLQIVVVVEADSAVVGVLQTGPRLVGERHDVGGEVGVEIDVVQSAQSGHVMRGDGLVGGVAEAGDRAQGGVGEGSLRHFTVADADGFVDAEHLSGLPGGAAGRVQAVGVAVADGRVGQGVGGFALDGVRKTAACVLGDGPVVGEVAAAAGGGVGEQGQGGGLARAGAGLQGEVLAGVEGVGSGRLFVGRVHAGAAPGVRVRTWPTAARRCAGVVPASCCRTPVEPVGLVAGVLDQRAVQGQLHEEFRALPRFMGSLADRGMGGGREDEVEQDLSCGVRVVGGDHVHGKPCGEALAQPVRGAAGGFGAYEGYKAGGVVVGGERQHADGFAEFG